LVFSNIKNYERYEGLHTNFKKAFQFLNREDLKFLLPGKYEIDGEEVFAFVQEYETKEVKNVKYEAHQKYIDIQYMLEGSEKMGYFPLKDLSVFLPYNIEEDFMLLDGEKELFLFRNNEFFIFFPEDAHIPSIIASKREKVKKVVIKVKV
jgi:biofilm protein TabA